jgi:GMC oxidoreductase
MKVMEEMHHAAGAAEAITIKREAHFIGGCRTAASEQDGVVDANLRSFAVPNLFTFDGSVCPTQGSANPALTITMALAARAADYLTSTASVAWRAEGHLDELVRVSGGGTSSGPRQHPLPRAGCRNVPADRGPLRCSGRSTTPWSGHPRPESHRG